QAVGDLYLAQMTAPQRQRFFDCATSGVLQVYQATGRVHGALGTPAMGLSSVDPTSDHCFGQRATNEAIVRGMAIHLKIATIQTTVPLDARFASWLVPQVARASGKVPVAKKTKNEFRLSLERVSTMARLTAKDDPQGTTLAEGGMGDFMGVGANGTYATPTSYEDPPLPWSGAGSDRAVTLARVFHLAHAKDWCAGTTVAQLEALKAHAQDPLLDATSKAAACAVCTEFTMRHLRFGTPASWDTTNEPLCGALAPASEFLYVGGSGSVRSLAQLRCCP
ncbi:MAG: hypothetical protein GQE15_28940, partial [Archangiaceae bacterium]|nr:hypothetical protein [Archangiaceae bacterium]